MCNNRNMDELKDIKYYDDTAIYDISDYRGIKLLIPDDFIGLYPVKYDPYKGYCY